MDKQIFEILGIRNYLNNDLDCMSYLLNDWGLSQMTVSKFIGVHQSKISIIGSTVGFPKLTVEQKPTFNTGQIEQLLRLPRTIIEDIPLVTFVQDILKIDAKHQFFGYLGRPAIRMAALDSLGIKQKFIAELFGKSAGTVSTNVNRNRDKVNQELPKRYDGASSVLIGDKPYQTIKRAENATDNPLYRALNHNPYAIKEPKMPWD
jgi:hypothetical protein